MLKKLLLKKRKKQNKKKKIDHPIHKVDKPTMYIVKKIFPKSKSEISPKDASIQKRYPATWQYFDKDKNMNPEGWYDYDTEASDIVEDHWQQYIQNRAMNDVRSVKSGEWEYMVDFMNWKQTNVQHQNHKVRNIRRLDDNGNITLNPYL